MPNKEKIKKELEDIKKQTENGKSSFWANFILSLFFLLSSLGDFVIFTLLLPLKLVELIGNFCFGCASVVMNLFIASPKTEIIHSKSANSKGTTIDQVSTQSRKNKGFLINFLGLATKKNKVVASTANQATTTTQVITHNNLIKNKVGSLNDNVELTELMKEYLKIQVGFQNNWKKNFRFLQISIFALTLFLIVQTGVLVMFGGNGRVSNASTNAATEQSQLKVAGDLNVRNEPGLKVVSSFQDKKQFTEIGAKIDISQTQISSRDTQNCRTPILPPLPNGCYFIFTPSTLNIPQKGTIYKSLIIEADLSGESQVYVQLKNYEKGVITKDIGSIKSDNVSKKIALPENISEIEGLQLTLWERGNPIVIKKIAIEYLNVDMFIPVSGTIAGWNQAQNTTGSIFEDVNENKIFDYSVDKPWRCKPNFASAGAVSIDTSGGFVIKREDNCYTGIKPDKWYTDEQKNSLPYGKWLLVIPGNQKESYSFEIKKGQTEAVLTLQ